MILIVQNLWGGRDSCLHGFLTCFLLYGVVGPLYIIGIHLLVTLFPHSPTPGFCTIASSAGLTIRQVDVFREVSSIGCFIFYFILYTLKKNNYQWPLYWGIQVSQKSTGQIFPASELVRYL